MTTKPVGNLTKVETREKLSSLHDECNDFIQAYTLDGTAVDLSDPVIEELFAVRKRIREALVRLEKLSR